MDIELIRTILDLMKANDLAEFEIEQDGVRIRLCKQGKKGSPEVIAVPQALSPVASIQSMANPAATGGQGPTATQVPDHNYITITAPMVGTFYRTPSPEGDPFVMPSDHVETDTVVCIIEAMKVMNEIKAEKNGRVVEVLVENGEAVEYGQPLFLLEPAEAI